MTRWWTSDMHYGHKNIITYCDRPFSSVEEMNAAMIANWNRVVGPEDEVIIVGDGWMCKEPEIVDIVAQLNGFPKLVPGNHDTCHPMRTKSVKMTRKYESWGIEVLPDFLTVDVLGVRFDVCHFPFDGDSQEVERFSELRPPNWGQNLICGHVHEKWKVRGRQINVGVDQWNFTPIDDAQLLRAFMNLSGLALADNKLVQQV